MIPGKTSIICVHFTFEVDLDKFLDLYPAVDQDSGSTMEPDTCNLDSSSSRSYSEARSGSAKKSYRNISRALLNT